MHTEIQVYYWKDAEWLKRLSFSRDVPHDLPTRAQFESDFARVATLEYDITPDNIFEVAEHVYGEMNLRPTKYIGVETPREKPARVSNRILDKLELHHTSMSIGDILIIGEVALICAPVGFMNLPLSGDGKKEEVNNNG